MSQINHPRIKNYVKNFHDVQRKSTRFMDVAFPDIWLLVCVMALIVIGMVMVSSASTALAAQQGINIDSYVIKQGGFYIVAFIVAYAVFCTPSILLQKRSNVIILLALIMLVLVFVPGIGYAANGSRRWLNFHFVKFQSGEVVKLAMIIFTAAFLTKRGAKVETSWEPMISLLVVAGVFAVMLLKQPDYGTTAVMMATLFGMLFLGGVPMIRFWILLVIAAIAMAVELVSEPYRVERIVNFLNPFADQYGNGYQLANSIVAIGHGGTLGLGLGNSIAKYSYVPEAHTDFIFSIIAEEFGFAGSLTVVVILSILVWRAFVISTLADRARKRFASYVACGIGIWIAIQSIINIGVVSGLLPTKGLTLPLVSYGGSSVLVTGIAMSILARIDAESRFVVYRQPNPEQILSENAT